MRTMYNVPCMLFSYLDSLKVIIEIRYAYNFIGNFIRELPSRLNNNILFVLCSKQSNAIDQKALLLRFGAEKKRTKKHQQPNYD